jgi:cytochrome P450
MAAEIRRLAAQLAEAGRFDPHRVTAPLALRMICIAVFGRQVLSEADEAALVGAVNTVEDELAEDMFRMIPLMPWAWWARQRRRAQGRTTMSVVVQRLRQAAGGASAIKALEDLGLTDDQVRDEILTLLLAGDHTTGSSAAWLLYHLASEPGLMDAIADEASAISDRNGEITAAGLKQAPLSLALTREVLRLYPSAWWFSREVKRPMHFGGMDLKPGTSIIISPWQLHRDPKHWAEPDTFRLDRTYTSKAYVPFGAGPRACIGLGVAMLELQLLALELAAAYRFAGVTPYPARLPKPSVTLIPPEMSIDIGLREKRRVRVASAA